MSEEQVFVVFSILCVVVVDFRFESNSAGDLGALNTPGRWPRFFSPFRAAASWRSEVESESSKVKLPKRSRYYPEVCQFMFLISSLLRLKIT